MTRTPDQRDAWDDDRDDDWGVGSSQDREEKLDEQRVRDTGDAGRGRGRQAAGKAAIPTPNWGLAFDLGLRLGLAIIIGLLLGLAVDNWLGTRPTFTLIGLVFGVAAAFYTIWDVANKSMNR